MSARKWVCLGWIVLLGGCEPPAKVTNPVPLSSAALGAASVSAMPVASAEAIPTSPVASVEAKPALPPCPPKVEAPADSLAWVNECHILIREQIVFDYNKSTIKPQSFSIVDAVGDILLRNPDLRVEIEGHLSEPEQHAYGRKLSQNRAESVRKYLMDQKGISPAQLSSKGYEGSKPIADPRTPEGRAQNRRIEFLILGWGGQIK